MPRRCRRWRARSQPSETKSGAVLRRIHTATSALVYAQFCCGSDEDGRVRPISKCARREHIGRSQESAPMFSQLLVYLGIFFTIAAVSALRLAQREREGKRQLRIAALGEACDGTIIAVQRPFLFDTSTRLFFEYTPPGRSDALRCCHIARCNTGCPPAMLPHAGARITVRYLPDAPQHAVIGTLIEADLGPKKTGPTCTGPVIPAPF